MSYKKRYAIYDMYHHSFFTFSLDDDEFTSYRTKKECEEAIQLCYILFFTVPHYFVVKPFWVNKVVRSYKR